MKEENIIKLNEEQLSDIIKEVINEELGSFENQNEIAEFLKQEAMEAYKNGDYDILSTIPYAGPIKYAEIHITDDFIICNLNGFNPNKKKVKINLPKSIFTDEKKLSDLMNSIAHELMHGNVYLQQTWRGQHRITVPQDYIKACEVRDGESEKMGVLYYFGYAWYNTYYHEVNACVSQTSAEIIDLSRDYNRLYVEDFKKLYARTNSVMAYKTNVKEMNRILSWNDVTIERIIKKPLERYDIYMSCDKIRNKCNEMLDISERALKDCMRNAMVAYDKLRKCGKLVGYDKQEPIKLKEYPLKKN